MPRRRGRPRTDESPVTRTRNLWWTFLSYHGYTPQEIAEQEGVHERTVRRGIEDAKSYPRGLRCRAASPEPQD